MCAQPEQASGIESTLGHSADHALGSERQRLKLATHMGEKGGLYALDGATSDLHLADVENLLGLPASRSSSSSTTRGWRTPTGSSTRVPAAGHDGGRIVFEGTPADLVAARSTLTGEHLAVYVGGGAEAVASR